MNSPFPTFPSLAATLAALSFAGDPALGQQPEQPAQQREGEQQDQTRPTLSILRHDDVIGAAVAGGDGSERIKLGTIRDVILQTATGAVRQAVIAGEATPDSEARLRLVAWSAMRFDGKRGFALPLTRTQFEALPEFDPQSIGGDGSAASNGAPVEASATRGAQTQLRATDLAACTVLASKNHLPKVAALWFEPASGQLAFLSVPVDATGSNGGTRYVMPWTALRYVAAAGDMGPSLQLAKSQLDLEAAPKVGGDGEPEAAETLRDQAFRERVYDYSGVERPTFETKVEAKQPAKGANKDG
jgi:hypothetical protein